MNVAYCGWLILLWKGLRGQKLNVLRTVTGCALSCISSIAVVNIFSYVFSRMAYVMLH